MTDLVIMGKIEQKIFLMRGRKVMLSTELAKLYENFIALELLRNNEKIKFWRTKAGAEIDLILEKNGEIIPIEIKSKLNSNSVEKGYRSFIEKYNPKKGYILSFDFDDSRVIEKTNIDFVSFIKFLIIYKNDEK